MEKKLYSDKTVESDRIIYTPSDFAKTSLLHLQETGSLTAVLPHTKVRENLHSYLFFIVLSGGGELEYMGKKYPLKAGDCVFLDCDKKYSHATSADLWSLKWVHFYGPNLAAIYEKYEERGGQTVFHPKDISGFEKNLDSINEIARNKDYLKDMHIFEQLSSLVTRIMEESWNGGMGKRHSCKKYNLQEIKDYIDQNYSEKITLDGVADIFFINKFYLTRIFKGQFGISVNGYITRVRITHAKKLLRFSNMSIEQIGHTCGMSDANYFSRVFKKVEGCSPVEFRKRW